MASINIAFGYAGGPGGSSNGTVPIFRGASVESITNANGTSRQTTGAAPATTGSAVSAAARIVADAAIWYTIGVDPTAAANASGSYYLPAGFVDFPYVTSGQKIAVIEA